MARIISNKTLYLNADKTKAVAEDSADAAFLLVRKGSALDADEAERYGVTGEEEPVYDAKADHEAKHGGESQQEADAKRQAMLRGESDPDGAPVAGERSDVDAKAVDQAPSNKAVSRKATK